jgi:signal transduction histidine kinase
MRNMPIQRKLMSIILLTSGVVMLLMWAAFFSYEYLTFRQALIRQVSSLGDILAANSTASLAFDNREDAREILSALRAERNLVTAALYDREGALFAHFPAGLSPDSLPAAPGPDGRRFTHAHLTAFHPVAQRGFRLGTLYLQFDSGALLEEFLWGSLKIAAAVMALVLVVAYFLSRFLQRGISAPILALAETASAVAGRGDYSVRAAKTEGGELGLLTDAFNQLLGQVQDLTRDLEKRVAQRTTQLEAANKELEAFSYSVSHDLRAPLRHIDGFAGLLLKSDGKAVSERGQGYLSQITKSAKHMGVLIDDLLVFARMGRAEMRIRPVELNELVDEVIRSMQPEIQGRNITWRRHPLPSVRGDPPMLRQVFVNLIANAIKYSRPRDPAIIEIGCDLDRADEFEFFVRDNGVGFEMKYADKLFGVFQRLHRAEEFEGTGIGLANVRRIVSRHGGRTWAKSAPGDGATFSFSIPKNHPPHP